MLLGVALQAILPRPLPRLPDKLLQDFRPTGAAYVIAKACFEKRRARNLKALDFKHPARKREVQCDVPRCSSCTICWQPIRLTGSALAPRLCPGITVAATMPTSMYTT